MQNTKMLAVQAYPAKRSSYIAQTGKFTHNKEKKKKQCCRRTSQEKAEGSKDKKEFSQENKKNTQHRHLKKANLNVWLSIHIS